MRKILTLIIVGCILIDTLGQLTPVYFRDNSIRPWLYLIVWLVLTVSLYIRFLHQAIKVEKLNLFWTIV